MRVLYKKHPNYFRIGGIVVLIIMLLFVLKSCSKQEKATYKELDKYVIEVESKDDETTKVLENLSYYWGSTGSSTANSNGTTQEGSESGSNSGKDDKEVIPEVFVCDEDTAKIIEDFGHEFIKKSEEYQNMLYIGDTTFSDQEYFNKKFEYYKDFGNELLSMASSMRENDEAKVLEQFDRLLEILELIEAEGEATHETI